MSTYPDGLYTRKIMYGLYTEGEDRIVINRSNYKYVRTGKVWGSSLTGDYHPSSAVATRSRPISALYALFLLGHNFEALK